MLNEMDLFKYLFTNREFHHGEIWLNDNRFFTPMITSACGDIFVCDFIHCSTMQQTLAISKDQSFLL